MARNKCEECRSTLMDGECPTPEMHVVKSGVFTTTDKKMEEVLKAEAKMERERMARSIQDLTNLPKFLRQTYDILKEKGIDLIDLKAANVERVKFWQAMHKDEAGDAVITDLQGITLSPGWETGPLWPAVQPAKAVKLPAPRSSAKKLDNGFKKAVVLPDMQCGYFHTGDPRDPRLEPIHDERALQIALWIIKEQQPDLIVFLGDNLDLAEFGKYRQYPQFAGTTQASIDRMAAMIAEIRNIVPEAKMVWLEGNHEARLGNMIIDNAKAAHGLRKAGDGFREIPVLSVPNLLRFDEYGVEYISGYPAGEYRITKWLTTIHGKYVKSDSATAQTYLRKGWDSVIFGHVHRIERLDHTRQSYKGPRTKIAASPGCLCRIDGVVPSTLGGMDIYGRPVPIAENWQQGLMVVDYVDDESSDDNGWFSFDQVTIWSGRAIWRGKEYQSTVSDTWLHPTVQPSSE